MPSIASSIFLKFTCLAPGHHQLAHHAKTRQGRVSTYFFSGCDLVLAYSATAATVRQEHSGFALIT